MADRNERDRDDVTGGKDEATPDAARDRDTTYDSSTSGGAADEIEEQSDTPTPSQRGRDLEH